MSKPLPSISYFVTQRLTSACPEQVVFLGKAGAFHLSHYAEKTGRCQVHSPEAVASEVLHQWRSPEHPLYANQLNGYSQIQWGEHHLEALQLSWPEGYSSKNLVWLIAPSYEVARDFYREVCAWCTEVRSEVMVFHGGCWSKDPELYQDIQGFRRQNLVLARDLKDQIWTDFERFFAARDLYKQHGIPWKRGVLFLGPPGNGKSHALKALINELEVPCLYVKSLKAQYSTEHSNIQDVFKRARDTTPCLLVFEDLDSQIHEGNRSYFLNELDGFAANEGILTLATSNYPERLDPAILERPSRFDRKYRFALPEKPERLAYLGLWNERLQDELRIDPEQLEELAEQTGEFSFAYLRELMMSSMMTWIHQPGPMAGLMSAQLSALREQMKAGYDQPAVATDEPDEMMAMLERARKSIGLD
ncbi:MAG: AAA family ATPase [Candidatus Eremiobacteraeota bacterium]|nr:AAA family ATPase [Candidatus Eremiobacteraeota bacterium]